MDFLDYRCFHVDLLRLFELLKSFLMLEIHRKLKKGQMKWNWIEIQHNEKEKREAMESVDWTKQRRQLTRLCENKVSVGLMSTFPLIHLIGCFFWCRYFGLPNVCLHVYDCMFCVLISFHSDRLPASSMRYAPNVCNMPLHKTYVTVKIVANFIACVYNLWKNAIAISFHTKTQQQQHQRRKNVYTTMNKIYHM